MERVRVTALVRLVQLALVHDEAMDEDEGASSHRARNEIAGRVLWQRLVVNQQFVRRLIWITNQSVQFRETCEC